MQYDVEIRVSTKGTAADTLRTLRTTWKFDENPKLTLAGEGYVVEQTAKAFAEKIKNELSGSNGDELDEHTGYPRRS